MCLDIVYLKNLQISPDKSFIQARTLKRIDVASTIEDMFKLACIKDKKMYAAVQGEDEYKTRGQIECKVIPVGQTFLKMWIASGIAKNFKYKRTIDIG